MLGWIPLTRHVINFSASDHMRSVIDKYRDKTVSGGVSLCNARGRVRLRRPLTREFERVVRTSPSSLWQTLQICLNHDYISILYLKSECANMMLKERAVSRAIPIVTSRGAAKRRELSPHNARHEGSLCSSHVTSNLWSGLNPIERSLPK